MERFLIVVIALVLVQQAIASTVCPLNEVYNECGSACPATCNNYKNPPEMCMAMCKVGCECAPGYVRNEADNTCCLESECPVTEQVCPLNEEYDECGSACPLTCKNYKNPPNMCTDNCVIGCRCQEGYVRNEADNTCCLESECPATETEHACPLNEVYNECGSACPATCDNYMNPPAMCMAMCKVGCECAPGYVRNEADNTCCLEAECPATETEHACPLNEVYNECGTSCPVTCNNYKNPPEICNRMCNAGCECAPGYVRNEADNTCCLESECPATETEHACPLNEVYNECGSACPATCNNYKNPPEMCMAMCKVGCECAPGYVRNEADNTCCLESECPATETEHACPLNEVYNECGSSCPATCDNYMNPPEMCNEMCNAGCECAPGYVRNEADNTCCLEAECPATETEHACPLNEVYNECGSACPATCNNYKNPPAMCMAMCKVGCECAPGYVRNEADNTCCLESECPATETEHACPLNEVYNECGSACPATCNNYKNPPAMCMAMCKVGCECAPGYVRNEADNTCCLESECPATETEHACPLNEVYNECGTSCPVTCNNYENPPEICMAMCKVGCECAPGYVRNEADNTCCLESECPATETEHACPLNEVYNECGSACPATCDNYKNPPEMCMAMCKVGCECAPGYVRNEADNTCCLESECPATETEHACPLNEVYNECGTSCPVTCNNYENPPEICNRMCNAGCECAPGYVRNEADNTCCLEAECPETETEHACPLNEVYNECGSACPATCDNYKNPPGMCMAMCKVGCECAPGYVRNEADNTCCLESECPATETEHACPLNEVYNECGTSCPVTCNNYENPPEICNRMCNAGCECAPGYVRNEADNTCCLESDCPATETEHACPLNEVYNECGSACPATCDNYKNPPEMCMAMCKVGCECAPGYVRNEADNTCCLESECPATETEHACPLNEVYNECGTSCPVTCNNYENPPEICNRMCNAGCECAPGYVRNEADNTCCLEAECPATETEHACPLNEVYNECGSACPATCDNYKNPPGMCMAMCKVGCECAPGYVRNEADNTCCLESECPATETEHACPLNEVYNECGTSCPVTCNNYENPPEICNRMCNAGCECAPGYVRNEADNTCCLESDCPATETEHACPLNEVYNECGSACPATCDNYKNPPEMCMAMCKVGCECAPGYVRNEADNTCCLESECPAPEPVCALNQVYTTCGTACPVTCENYNNPPRFCTMQCVAGCECNKGYVKKSDGSCCLPSECKGKRTWRSLLTLFKRRY